MKEKLLVKSIMNFRIKMLKKLGIERMHFNIRKTIYNKPIANSILNGKN
jgi:hypothetical protein